LNEGNSVSSSTYTADEIDDQSKRSNDEDFSIELAKAFFQRRPTGVVVECGSHTGKGGSIGYRFEKAGWEAYNIEVNPYCHEMLDMLRPDSTNVKYGLWSEECTKTLLLPQFKEGYKFPAGSSFIFDREYFNQNKKQYLFTEIEVPLKTYAQFVEEYNIPHIDLFILDVEGAEGEVLDGIGDAIKPDVFAVEDPKDGYPAFDDKLIAMGYVKSAKRCKDNSFWSIGGKEFHG
jgi:FkbM family methyltransferase